MCRTETGTSATYHLRLILLTDWAFDFQLVRPATLAKALKRKVRTMNPVITLAPGIEKISKGSLYPHQSDGVAFLLSKKQAILADDMGLGKTRQAIVAMEAGCPDGAVLVVCPASLKLNWKREILIVDGDASIEVLGVDAVQVKDPRWIIINYDILSKHADRLHTINWSGIILDEAHCIKNASKRTTHCMRLLGVQEVLSDKCHPVSVCRKFQEFMQHRVAATQQEQLHVEP